MFVNSVVIPCYNESRRLMSNEFIAFANSNQDVALVFVNDGSTDNTLDLLNKIASGKSNIAVISLSENLGKASAVSYGIKYALENYRSKYYSYLDADLAIPLTELQRLLKIINSSDRIQFIFYSKYKNEKIKHSTKRRIISKILNILVKLTLKINVSDTQCGCKIMSYDIATTLFKEEFISKWLFDVEIFWRLIKNKGYIFFQNHCLEVPLEKFQNQEESKIRLLSLLKLPLDFIYIFKKYK